MEYDKYIWGIHTIKVPFSDRNRGAGGLKVHVKNQNKLWNDKISYDPDSQYDWFDVMFDNFIERPKGSCWCHDCEYETIYEGYCCEYDYDEYPYSAHKCPLYSGEVEIPNTIEGWLYQMRYYYGWCK